MTDVLGGEYLVYIETWPYLDEFTEADETAVYATPARESRRRSTITVLRNRHLTLTAVSPRTVEINRSLTIVARYARCFRAEFGRVISRNDSEDR